ncbi:hypothetical protein METBISCDRAFT_23423 [Metschnikowia bicuspidata]|uniref:separase n=1 Tax=Metschnikowia bicuspidata TaxID=27322 RepID=A0A4P9ZBT1_9ASCO|nr:hypothetical protein METBISCDRAFT_23423 [Metschnikowia bicuspidata]
MDSKDWLKPLNAYLLRLTSPLFVLSPNHTSPIGEKAIGPLSKAKQVVSNYPEEHDPELVRAAFKIAYLKAISRDEVVLILKKHQRYIVHLSTQQKPDLSRHELSTMCSVLSGSKEQRLFTWEELLQSRVDSAEYPVAFVVSFYFFVIQGILLDVLQSLNPRSRNKLLLEPSFLWEVATVFLSGSRFSCSISTLDRLLHDKYLKNKIKMLSGFRKITNSLVQKNKSDAMRACNCAFALKLSEYSFLADGDSRQSVPPLLTHTLEAFIQDYNQTLNSSDTLSKLPSSDNPSDKISSDYREETRLSQPLLEKISKYADRLNGHLTDSLLAEITEFVRLHKNDSASLRDILSRLMPVIEPVLKEKHANPISQLARSCFEYGNANSSVLGLKYAVLLDLKAYALNSSPRDSERLVKRIEYSIWTILKLKEPAISHTLLSKYLSTVRQRQADDSLIRMVSEAFAQGLTLERSLFGGLILKKTDQEKLFKSVIPVLAKRPADPSTIKKICSVAKDLPLSSTFELVRHFDVPFDASSVVASKNDGLFLAGIKTEGLLRSVPQKSDLVVIEKLLLAWMNTESQGEEDAVFLHISERLFQMGYYSLCDSLLAAFISKERCSPVTSYALLLLRSSCLLKTNDTDAIPALLKHAAECLKEMASKGVSPIDVMPWKLLQLEYFLQMNDKHKLVGKLSEISGYLSSREEFQLSDQTASSLDDRLASVLILAQYQLLASKHYFHHYDFTRAIKYSKLSLKFVKSVLRIPDVPPGSLLKAKYILGQSLQAAYIYHRHVGLAKEANTFLSDLHKFNQTLEQCFRRAYGHFDLATSLVYSGKTTQASEEHSLGTQIAFKTNSILLEVCRKIAATAIVYSGGNPLFESECVRVCHSMEELQSTSDRFQALSILEVESLYIQLNSSCPSKSLAETPTISRIAKSNRYVMLLKALAIIKSEIAFDMSLLRPRIFHDNSTMCEMDQNVHAALVSRRECLLKMIEQKYFASFDNFQQREIYHMLRACSMIHSKIATENLDREAEMNSLIYFEDASRNAPYEHQRSLLSSAGQPVSQFPTTFEPPKDTSGICRTFLKDFLSQIPANWAVVSLDVCSVSGDLLVTRIRSQAPPLVLNIPITRLASSDSFEKILGSLKEIIARSNMSTKSNVTSKVKTREDRKNWWRNRIELDLLLRDILTELEDNLIGGLKGIFEPGVYNEHHFKSFSDSLNAIWTRTLETPPKFRLDNSICELFYNIDPFLQIWDHSDRLLTDLTLFCLEIYDHNLKVKVQELVRKMKDLSFKPKRNSNDHLVLITSDCCLPIPWESIGFLRGRSITRVPSLRCMQDIFQRHKGLYVPKSKPYAVSYLVNPGNDLSRTQSVFEPIFSNLTNVVGVCGKAPSEEKVVSLITSSNLYVYLGHGGGEQYFRMSSITNAKQSDGAKSDAKFPPALLMGCSSCAFQENGRLPTSSNIFNWLVRGSPAVVANLWDVTDKDIDVFTLSMLEEWGLIPKSKDLKSLADAVAISRDKCILKYLNGAAPVVYGLPLRYVQDQDS